MQRWKVDSSMILAINYAHDEELLELELHSGAVWRFRRVPGALVEAMLDAPSKGKFYHAWLRDLFACEIVRGEGGREVSSERALAS